jgi:hypothetical protein
VFVNRAERLVEFIKQRANRLNITTDEVNAEPGDEPEFVKAAVNRAARRGVDPDAILDYDAERLNAPPYPALECLMGYEVDPYEREGELPPDRAAHVERCASCKSLLFSKASSDRVDSFLNCARARALRSRSGVLRDLIIPWLAQPNWSIDQLVDWFKRKAVRTRSVLPAEAHREVLIALAGDPERERWEHELARRLGALRGDTSRRSNTPSAPSDWTRNMVPRTCSLAGCMSRPGGSSRRSKRSRGRSRAIRRFR